MTIVPNIIINVLGGYLFLNEHAQLKKCFSLKKTSLKTLLNAHSS